MTHIFSSARPARAAIAAVLAFSATPLLAQEIAPPAIAPTIVPVAPVSAPTASPMTSAPAPVMGAPAPVVQAVPSVEERRAAAVAQVEAEATQRPALVERVKASPVRQSVAAEKHVAKPVELAHSPVTAKPATPVAVVPAPVEVAVAPAIVPPVAKTKVDGNGDALGWGLAGGALLLIGIAGTMAMRRRKMIPPADAAVVAQTAYVPPVATAELATPLLASPTVSRPLVQAEPHVSVEQMVAAPPSAANPFLTRRNRLRRAEFLLRQSEQPVMTQRAETGRVEHEDRSQMVYRYGVNQPPRTRWVPAKA